MTTFIILLASAAVSAQTLGDIVGGFRTLLANANVTTLQEISDAIRTQGNLNIGSTGEVKTPKEISLAAGSKVGVQQGGKVTTQGVSVDSGVATIEGGLLNFGTQALGLIKAGATLVLDGSASFKGAINTAADSKVELRGNQTCDSTTQVKGAGLLLLKGSLNAEGSAMIVLGERDKTKVSLSQDCIVNAVSAAFKFAAAATIEAATTAGSKGCQCKGKEGIVFDNGCSMVDKSKITVSEESKCVVAQGPVAVKPDCSAIVTGGGKFQVQATATIEVQANANITFETPCELQGGAAFNIAAGASATLKAATTIVSAAAKAYFNLAANASLLINGPFTCDNKCGVKGEDKSVVTFSHTPDVSATTTVVVSDSEMKCESVHATQNTKLDFNGTVSLDASLEVSGSAIVAVNPGVMTCKKEVKCSGGELTIKSQSVLKVEAAIHVEASAKLDIQQNSNVTTKTCNCGQQAAMPATKSQLIIGGQLTVTGGINLDASKCDLKADNSEIVVEGSMTAEEDLRSEFKAGEYKVKQLSCRGKSWVRNTGQAVIKGAVRVQAQAHFEAQAKFDADTALMVEDDAKVTSHDSLGCNEAKFGDRTTFVAKYSKVAAESVASLVVKAKASFSGTVEIETTSALKKGDKFIIAKYGSHEGKFSKVMVGGNGRKRAADDWTVDYQANQAVATYNGDDQTAVPTTLTVLSTSGTTVDDSAATLSVGVAALVASLALAL